MASSAPIATAAPFVVPLGAAPNSATPTPAATRTQNIKNIQTTLRTACEMIDNIEAQKKQFIRVTKNIPTHDLYNMLVGGHAELREVLQNFIFERMRASVMEDIERCALEEKAAPDGLQPAHPHMDIFAACIEAAAPKPAKQATPQAAQLAKQAAPQVPPRPIQVINKLPSAKPKATDPPTTPLAAAPPTKPAAAPPVTTTAMPTAAPPVQSATSTAAPPVQPVTSDMTTPSVEAHQTRPNQKARRWIKKQQNQ
jgi:hypothetical protein